MWPSEYADLIAAPLHARCLELAKVFMGDDAVFDFDMLIYKAAHTATDVPWHSDEGYWPDMVGGLPMHARAVASVDFGFTPRLTCVVVLVIHTLHTRTHAAPSRQPDKRAASFWVALTDVHPDMGSMWFVPGSHKEPLLPHRHAVEGEHVMCVDGVTEADGVATSLRAGSCTVHSGRTLHYTRGNSTDRDRPAFIANYRPESMVQWERENGFDHGRGGVGVFLPDKE